MAIIDSNLNDVSQCEIGEVECIGDPFADCHEYWSNTRLYISYPAQIPSENLEFCTNCDFT